MSTNDREIKVEELREWMNDYIQRPRNCGPTVADLLTDLQSRLLAPPLPTLADMTPEEREACQWMQCKLANSDNGIYAIASVGETSAKVIAQDGFHLVWENCRVTPLPDLPRLKWPASAGDGSEEQRLSAWDEVSGHGFFKDCFDSDKSLLAAMIDKLDSHMGDRPSTDLPRPEDVAVGEPWIVLCGGKEWIGVRAKDHDFIPWSIVRMDGLDNHDVSDSKISLVSRLVPESKENA